MKNFGIKQIGILKCQYGTPRGGLVNHDYSGTWGNRGQGNELQSALENGLSWIEDKIVNFWDYADLGLAWIGGAFPGGMTPEELLQDEKRKQAAKKAGQLGYVDHYGNYKVFPITGTAPLPGIKGNSKTTSWDDLYELYLAKTKITAGSPEKIYQFRRATDTADRFVAGKQVTLALENSKEFTGYAAHGMAKGHDLEMLARLRTILRYGTDPKRTFYTAPVSKIDPRLHSAMGTANGHAYSDGPFMLLTKYPLNTTRPGAISHVLINDGLGDEALELANKYKTILLKEFPNVKHLLYSEVK